MCLKTIGCPHSRFPAEGQPLIEGKASRHTPELTFTSQQSIRAANHPIRRGLNNGLAGFIGRRRRG